MSTDNQKSNPINPAPAGEAAAGGTPRSVKIPQIAMDLFEFIQTKVPTTIVRNVKYNEKNVFAFQIENKLFFLSWHEAIPELEEIMPDERSEGYGLEVTGQGTCTD